MSKGLRIALLLELPLAVCALCAGEAPRPAPAIPGFVPINSMTDDDLDMSAPAKFDEVVHDLVEQLLNKHQPQMQKDSLHLMRTKENAARDAVNEKEQFTVNAQDAARKLAGLGKRAVPDLTYLFKKNCNHKAKDADAERAAQIAYYSAWALARIRTAEAAHALIPLMTDPTAPSDLRLIAVNASGWEKSAEGISVLAGVAADDPDIEMRKLALGQIAMIPEFWDKAEPIFVKALSDPNDDIRVQAAKACHYSHRFVSANTKLIELIEKDPCMMVRIYAMLTVARLKVFKAQPVLIRVLQDNNADEKIRKQAFNALTAITDVPFRSVENVMSWWEKTGKIEAENYARNEQLAIERADDIKNKRPIKLAPKNMSLNDDSSLTGAIIRAPNATIGEVIPLKDGEKNDAPKAETPAAESTAKDEPPPTPKVIDPPDDTLNPKQSSGSQRRRVRKTE